MSSQESGTYNTKFAFFDLWFRGIRNLLELHGAGLKGETAFSRTPSCYLYSVHLPFCLNRDQRLPTWTVELEMNENLSPHGRRFGRFHEKASRRQIPKLTDQFSIRACGLIRPAEKNLTGDLMPPMLSSFHCYSRSGDGFWTPGCGSDMGDRRHVTMR